MTIAVAALWPWDVSQIAELWEWERLQGLNPPFPPTPRAGILMSDSRWTYSPGKTHDWGSKLFRLTHDAGAVYSGHVPSGEDALNRLGKWFHKGKVRSPAKAVTAKLLRQTYGAAKSSDPLRVFVASCGPTGPAQLLYFDSDHRFVPLSLYGVRVLARPDTEHAFRTGLSEAMKEIMRGSADITLAKSALCLAIALQQYVIGPGIDDSVGGKIQCAIVDQRGFHRMGLSRGYPDDTKVISAAKDDMTLYRPNRESRRDRRFSRALQAHDASNQSG